MKQESFMMRGDDPDEDDEPSDDLEVVLDDVLQLLAEDARATTRRMLARERTTDLAAIRLHLYREAIGFARGQYRRNEEATKARRRMVRYGNSKPTNLIASSSQRAQAADTTELACDHLLQSLSERKTATRDRRMAHDLFTNPEQVRDRLVVEIDKLRADLPKKSKRSKSISKTMR